MTIYIYSFLCINKLKYIYAVVKRHIYMYILYVCSHIFIHMCTIYEKKSQSSNTKLIHLCNNLVYEHDRHYCGVWVQSKRCIARTKVFFSQFLLLCAFTIKTEWRHIHQVGTACKLTERAKHK